MNILLEGSVQIIYQPGYSNIYICKIVCFLEKIHTSLQLIFLNFLSLLGKFRHNISRHIFHKLKLGLLRSPSPPWGDGYFLETSNVCILSMHLCIIGWMLLLGM